MEENKSVVPFKVESSPEAGRDPIKIMIEIAKDKDLSDADKAALISYANARFKNRRKMAYISLYVIVVSLGLIFVGAFIDGIICHGEKSCYGILDSIKENQTLITWVEGFLTSIVAAYYGVTSWRPSS